MQKKGFRGDKQRYICINCKKNWTDRGNENNSNNKLSLEEKITYVTKAKNEQLSLKIKYKGVNRTIFPYSSDRKYCVAYCNYRNELRTFRIDKMQDIEIGTKFELQGVFKREADSKIRNIEPYHYKRYY